MLPSALTLDAVKSALDEDPRLIGEWELWSQDKRTTGWYLRIEQGSHVVGRFPEGDRLIFPDAVTACAEFIIRELQAIG
jgi:hypothetical protein